MARSQILKKSISASKYSIFLRIIAQIISFFATIILVRVLPEHEYGIYNLLYSVIAILGMVFSFGIANTLQRYMPEYYSRGEFRIANNLYRSASLIRLFSNVIILGLSLIFWDQISHVLKISAYKNYFILFTLIIILHMQRGILETCLNSFFLHKFTYSFTLIFILIKGISYYIIFLMGETLWFIISADLIAYFIIFVLLFITYNNNIPKTVGEKNFNQKERKRVIRYAIFYNFNDAGIGFLEVEFDNFIIAMFLNPLAVGAYAFCNNIVKMINRVMPLTYLIDVIRPAVFSSGNITDISQLNRNFLLLLKIILLFQFPVFCILTLFSRDIIIFLFNGKFLEYYHMLNVIYLFNVLNAFMLPLGLVAQQKEKADLILYSKVFGIYNIIADIILIKLLGLWGVIIATSSAVFFKNLFIWHFLKKEASFHGFLPFIIRVLIIWFVYYVCISFLRVIIPYNHIIYVIGLLTFLIALYFQFRLIHFTESEKNLLKIIGEENKFMSHIFKRLKFDFI